MRFQQIKDPMLYLGGASSSARAAFTGARSPGGCWRSRMLLAHLQGREDAGGGSSARLSRADGKRGEGTWLDQGFGGICWPRGIVWRCPPQPSPREIVAPVSRQEEAHRRAGTSGQECPTPDTAVLKSLASMAQSHLTRLVHGAHRLDDLWARMERPGTGRVF